MGVNKGLDLGSGAIKLLKLSGDKVEVAQMVSNPLGKVTITTEDEATKLAEVIKKLLLASKMVGGRFNVVIPESVVYSRVIELPVLTDAELGSAIKWEAEQYVPVPLDSVELSWEVIQRPKKKTGEEKMRVYLVAADKKVISGLVNVFTKIGLEPETIEPEMVAVARSVVLGKKISGPVMVCSMGASSVSIAVFDKEQMLFVYRFGSGGTTLTRAISTTLQLPMPQAEEYKRSYGVRADLLEGKLLAAMSPVLAAMISEIKRAISFYTQLSGGKRLTRILLTGGTALTPGLLQWMTAQLGMEVVMANVFEGLKVDPEISKLGMVYAPVLGALR